MNCWLYKKTSLSLWSNFGYINLITILKTKNSSSIFGTKCHLVTTLECLYLGCQNETIRAEKEREMFFVSPSFPNVNNAKFDCTWRLQAPEGMRVKIRWPVFHLDSCGSKNMLNREGDQSSRTSSQISGVIRLYFCDWLIADWFRQFRQLRNSKQESSFSTEK